MTKYTGTPSSETILGGDGDDYLAASGGLDLLQGGAGNDTISATGGDAATGGLGSDTFITGSFATQHYTVTDFQAGAGGDVIDASNLLNYASFANGYMGGNPFINYLALVQSGTDTLLQFHSPYWQDRAAVTILTLKNVEAATLTADNFLHRLDPSGRLAPVDGASMPGTEGNDSLSGSPFGEILDGGEGDDTLLGWGGDDTLVGGAGNDSLSGGSGGANRLDGGAGNDTLSGDGTLLGGDGSDSVTGSGTLLDGGAGNDTLSSYYGTATINGGSGDDVIDSSGGVISGGGGRDVFSLSTYRTSVVTDFQAGDGGDKLDLRYALLDIYTTGERGVDFLKFEQSGADVLIRYDRDGSSSYYSMATVITLKNVQLSSLTLDNHLGISEGVPYSSWPSQLFGGLGNDRLFARLKGDTLTGFAGNDEYLGTTGTVVIERPGEGIDTFWLRPEYFTSDQATYTLAANVENLVLDRYSGRAWGNELDNQISMTATGKVDGAAGNDTITGSAMNDTLAGGAGNDVLAGGGGSDSIDGGAGNDVLVGGGGSDAIDGGAGNDTVQGLGARNQYQLAREGQSLRLTSADGTVTLTNVETIVFSNGVHTIASLLAMAGTDGNDKLTGTAGVDYLDGMGGNDTLAGGAGNDYYMVDSTGDVVTEAASGGIDTVRVTAATYTLPTNVEHLTHGTWEDGFQGTGNALDNRFIGNASGETFHGGVGNDSFNGRGGNDAFVGGAGNDWMLNAGTGTQFFDGGTGTDGIDGLAARDQYTISRWSREDIVLTAIATGDTIRVRDVEQFDMDGVTYTLAQLVEGLPGMGDDVITGTADADVLEGFGGRDTLIGGAGDDTYLVDDARALVVEEEGAGYDTVRVAVAAAQPYQLGEHVEEGYAAAGILAIGIAGNAAANLLRGNGAANVLAGKGGSDTLDGGAGADRLAGGADNDLYIVDAGDIVTELDGEGIDTVMTELAKYTLTANVEALVYNGAGAFTGTGNADDNLISGSVDQADMLSGADGNDTLAGLSGNDTLDGGKGIDTVALLGARSAYTISRPNNTDTIVAREGETVTLRGIEAVQFLDGYFTLASLLDNTASPLPDMLTGTANADTLVGLGGNDTLSGGEGDDLYTVETAGDVVVELAGQGTDTVQVAFASGSYTLGENVEHAIATGKGAVGLTGNAVANRLTGNGASNVLAGGAGNDTLDGGAGADKLSGGLGDDTYRVDAAGDSITERPNEGLDTVVANLSKYTLAAEVEQLTYDGTAGFAGTGNILANRIEGGSGGDSLAGLGGDDTLAGGAGNDTLDGGAGDGDTAILLGYGYQYVVTRTSATDTVLTGPDQAVTLRGIEKLQFLGGTVDLAALLMNRPSKFGDVMTGTANDDELDGLAGSDTMSGGQGSDRYAVDSTGDIVIEKAGEGIDHVDVALAAGTYVLSENIENATVSGKGAAGVTGNGAANTLVGNAAANALTGGAGDDTLDGGLGADKLVGGSGDDTYRVDAAGDSVTELANGGTDTVSTSLASYTLGAHVENLASEWQNGLAGTGNALGNRIDGNGGNDRLLGMDGNDTLCGHTGTDTIDGGKGDDTLVLLDLPWYYTITRVSQTDTLFQSGIGLEKVTVRDIERVQFGDGSTVSWTAALSGVAGGFNDSLIGTGADDTLNGLGGSDTMEGGDGSDRYTVDMATDVIVELAGNGNDSVDVALASGSYTLSAHVENATVTSAGAIGLVGNGEANWLVGNAAANILGGGAGDDILDGGLGADRLTGGAGADSFVVGFGNDAVLDFDSSDWLVIDAMIGNGNGAIDSAVELAAPGAFGTDVELVLVKSKLAALTPADLVKAIGMPHQGEVAYPTMLFVAQSGKTSGVFLYTSDGDDSAIVAGELVQIATITGVPVTLEHIAFVH